MPKLLPLPSSDPFDDNFVWTPEVKFCNFCRQSKPLTEFRPGVAKGNQGRKCRQCYNEYMVRRRAKMRARTGKELPAIVEKKCNRCGAVKSFKEFNRRTGSVTGLCSYCKECAVNDVTTHYAKNRRDPEWYEKNVVAKKLVKFGLSLNDYKRLLADQNGVCAICSKPETRKIYGKTILMAVDHCHKTGRVRGLLCGGCNKGIGHFGDDPSLLVSAADYLRRSVDPAPVH